MSSRSYTPTAYKASFDDIEMEVGIRVLLCAHNPDVRIEVHVYKVIQRQPLCMHITPNEAPTRRRGVMILIITKRLNAATLLQEKKGELKTYLNILL